MPQLIKQHLFDISALMFLNLKDVHHSVESLKSKYYLVGTPVLGSGHQWYSLETTTVSFAWKSRSGQSPLQTYFQKP